MNTLLIYSAHKTQDRDAEAAVCNLASLCLPKILDYVCLDALRSSKIEVYTKDNCGWCTLAKGTLKKLDLDFIEHNLTEETMATFFDSYQVNTVPQIFVDDKRLGGYTELWNEVKPHINYNKLVEMAKSVKKIFEFRVVNRPYELTKKSHLPHSSDLDSP